MAKKNMKSIVTSLAAVAEDLPTQNIQRRPRALPEAPASAEPVVQFSLSMRKSQRKELARLADDADMTMRALVLNALKKEGLTVTADDLLDLRKEGRGQ